MQLQKAYFKKVDGGSPIHVLFNPAEISVNKTVNWSPKKKDKRELPRQEYTAGSPRELSMKLDFDTTGGLNSESATPEDVRKHTDPILKLAWIEEGKKEPPTVEFQWGSAKFMFVGVLKQANVTFTKFAPDGTPVRANLTVSLVEAPNEPELLSGGGSVGSIEIFEAPQNSSVHSFCPNPEDWRATADANNVNNPRQVPAGQAMQRARP